MSSEDAKASRAIVSASPEREAVTAVRINSGLRSGNEEGDDDNEREGENVCPCMCDALIDKLDQLPFPHPPWQRVIHRVDSAERMAPPDSRTYCAARLSVRLGRLINADAAGIVLLAAT
jgi:hypothetical protein